ncbi:hypothetical protein BDR07DRAFT_1359012, partial [Suillus spraguei]
MKKIFGRDKARQQRVTLNRDADFVINDDALLVRPEWPSEVLSELPFNPYPQFDKERGRLWREEDIPLDMTRMIGYLTATSSEDWALVFEVCERASATEANAKEVMKALLREFRYGQPTSQLSAARLWAILLRNASDIFLTQINSRKFIDTLEEVLTSSRTNPVVRERLMEVLAAAAFITSSRPNPSPKPEPSPFSLKDRDRDRDSFRNLWMRLKPADKPDVGIPFDTEDAMFSPSIVPPIKERPSRKNRHQRGIIPPEENIKRLFQECKIAKGNATVLSEMLAFVKPGQIEGSLIPEFLLKCRASQELIYTQIPWAAVSAERLRSEQGRNAAENGRTKSQPDVQFSSPPSRDYHGTDVKSYNAEGEEQTLEEELFGALLDANEVLLGALRMYDDIMRVAEKQVAVEISRRDVEMDRRHIENEYLGESYHDYGGGSPRTPSPVPSPPASPRPHDLPTVVPSQNHLLLRVPPALSPAHSHYGSPLQNIRTPTLLAPPPHPMGPRSPAFPPSPDRGGLVRPSRGNSLENTGGALDRLHMYENDVEEEEVQSPIRPSEKALGKRRVVEEIDDELDSSDLHYKPRRESVGFDSDEEVRSRDHANAMWPWRQPRQYVYDAAAERTAHERERNAEGNRRMQVVEEHVVVESRRDVKMDRRVEQAYLGPSHRYYEEGSSRTPSPMSSPHTSRTPSPPTLLRQLDLPPIVPSQAYLLPRLSPAHSHYGPPPPRVNTSPLLVPPLPSLPHPLLPMPSPPLYNTSPMRPSAKVVEEVDDEPHDLINSRFALDKAGATSSLTMVPMHPPMEEEASTPVSPVLDNGAMIYFLP